MECQRQEESPEGRQHTGNSPPPPATFKGMISAQVCSPYARKTKQDKRNIEEGTATCSPRTLMLTKKMCTFIPFPLQK